MARGMYQLWDLTTGNCAGAYDDEATALAEVRAGVHEDGPDSFDGVALVRAGVEVEDLGQGRALVARALAAPELPTINGQEMIARADMTTPLDPSAFVPNLDIRSWGDVRITADGRRVVVEIDTHSSEDETNPVPTSEIRRRA